MSNGVNIGNYSQHGGNTAIGSTKFTQNSTVTVTLGEAATGLAGLLLALQELNVIPEELQQETADTAAELQTAVEESSDPRPALGRARRLGTKLNELVNTNPTLVAFGQAIGTYAAISAGLPG